MKRQSKVLEQVQQEKHDLDQRLTEELENYDSQFVAQSREADHLVATLEERARSLERLKKLPETIERLLREAAEKRAEEENLRREILEETARLTTANEVVQEIEDAYLAALRAVGVPGVGPDDRVRIDRKSWIPSILEQGDDGLAWNFYSTGSGGKKTLVNVCYALAVHQVAAMRDLPLPSFLIVDTPMKNIGEDVNRDVFVSFYRYLYTLAEGPLADTQLVMIDKEFIPPEDDSLDLSSRFMTPNDDSHPPLIGYYRGAYWKSEK